MIARTAKIERKWKETIHFFCDGFCCCLIIISETCLVPVYIVAGVFFLVVFFTKCPHLNLNKTLSWAAAMVDSDKMCVLIFIVWLTDLHTTFTVLLVLWQCTDTLYSSPFSHQTWTLNHCQNIQTRWWTSKCQWSWIRMMNYDSHIHGGFQHLENKMHR